MKSIQSELEKRFPHKDILPSDDPIELGFHTEDYDINGEKVRLRFWSPQHLGDKSLIVFHPLTSEQIKEVEDINKKFELKKKEKEKKDKELREWSYQQMMNRRRY